MDGARILEAYQEMERAFPAFQVAYAMKANPDLHILKLLQGHGGSFETASISEIELLTSVGVSPEKIIFSNPIKPIEAIARSVQAGVYYHTFDSISEIDKFAPYGDRIGPIFRIDVSNKGSLWALNGKFGAGRSLWSSIFSHMSQNNIPLKGITFHVGSQCETLETWELALESAKEAILLARGFGLNPDTLNIGGGFPIYLGREVPSVTDISRVIYRHLSNWEKEEIIIKNHFAEPGRYIAGPAGTLISKIIGIADREAGDKIEKWVFLDTGVFTGLMETIDGITYPLVSNGSGEPVEVMLCGPSCDSADKMYRAELPDPKIGDTLYLTGAGAYTTSYVSNFNGLDTPLTVFMDDESSNVTETAAP